MKHTTKNQSTAIQKSFFEPNTLNIASALLENPETTPPLIVKKKWDFKLDHIDVDGNPKHYLYHAVQWTLGLGASSHTTWERLKEQLVHSVDNISIRQLPYTLKDGRTYQVDFIDEATCYEVVMSMRVTSKRPQLVEIRDYLKTSGVLISEMFREPEKASRDWATIHDQRYAKQLEAQGYPEDEILKLVERRRHGKVQRKLFTEVLKSAVIDPNYAAATNDVYMGLWQRTAAILKQQIGLKKYQPLRDFQHPLAIWYEAIVEQTLAAKLKGQETLTWEEAEVIIIEIANMIGVQARQTGEYIGIDLPTNKPLLGDGTDHELE